MFKNATRTASPVNRFSYAYLALLTFGSLLLLRNTQAINPSIAGDSGVYLAAAQSFLYGDGLLDPSGHALTIFPPGYPLLLAFIATLGTSVVTAATIINLIAFALLISGTFLLARMTLGGTALPIIAATLMATSTSIYRVFSNAWTEPLFMVLMLAVLILLVDSINQDRVTWSSSLAMGVLISLATTLRFVGVFIIPVLVITLLYLTWRERKPGLVITTTAISLVGFITIGLHNLSLGAGFMGDRSASALTLQGSIEQFVRQLGVYIAPPETTSLTNFAGALLLVALIASVWLIYIHNSASLYPLCLYFIIFWGALMWSQTSTRIDINPERLGSPAFAVVIILMLYALQISVLTINAQLSVRLGRETKVLTYSLAIVIIGLVIAANLINSLRMIS